ncbi:unnamed protein product [Rhizoctonia solani]|uniref:Uncharacterized protein n=1 Tax=Rhizoctonia solani TaxID=456999 RepID=A0A8H3BRS2_9AGAM|nr:unnamed protein product [Rhizoctonia solani]
MSKRFASFNGPSTPNKQPTPTKKKKQPPTPQTKPKIQHESEIQRRIRRTLKSTSLELHEWERCGLHDAKWLVDQATELEYALYFVGVQPRFRVVTEKLRYMNMYKEDMRARIGDMATDLARFSKRATKIEHALTEFVHTHGIHAVEQTPLWPGKTWSLVLHMHKILRPLTRFHHTIQDLSENIIAYGLSGGFHSTDSRLECDPPAPGQGATVPTFEETKSRMVQWAAEAKAMEEWIKEWDEMCALEVVGWEKMPELDMGSSDEDMTDW